MTLEQSIQDLIGALDRNTAALQAEPAAAKGKGKKAEKEPAVQAQAAAPAQSTSQQAPVPPVESVNAAILALAKVNRDKAVEVLSKFGVTRTPELKPENYQAAIDLAEEEKAKIDAAATQQSLV